MVAGFNISNKCVVCVGPELPNPLEKTRSAHWEVLGRKKERKKGKQANRNALLSVSAVGDLSKRACAAQIAGLRVPP